MRKDSVASRSVVPMFGRGFGVTQARPLIAPGEAGGSVTHMLLGAACGALAVCGVQLLMVVLSEMDLKRSVDAISE
jgi:hypothetical protein